MKKITILAVAVVAISLVSCRKDRSCECTVITSGTSVTASIKAEKQTKRYFRKENECYNQSVTQVTNSNGVTNTYAYEVTDCKLK